MSTEAMPHPVSKAGVTSARELDVRPVLSKGGDPFHLIMKTVQSLLDTEALHLIVGFEPKPLYSVMRAAGRESHTEHRDGTFHVWFFKDPNAAIEDVSPTTRVPLQPAVTLDVRGLEPPQPMVTILEKLAELGPGAQLLVHHHREPVLLYDKLKLRGYAARAVRHGDGNYVIEIAPAWAFESSPTSSR